MNSCLDVFLASLKGLPMLVTPNSESARDWELLACLRREVLLSKTRSINVLRLPLPLAMTLVLAFEALRSRRRSVERTGLPVRRAKELLEVFALATLKDELLCSGSNKVVGLEWRKYFESALLVNELLLIPVSLAGLPRAGATV